MVASVLVGCQWGDEGKGKIVDYISDSHDIIARYQGGSNAGHTVIFGSNVFKFHHVPSGILHKEKLAIMGNGMVVDCNILEEEIKDLKNRGYDCSNLRISDRSNLLMPYHRTLDVLEEAGRTSAIGTTKMGIGPCYTSKIGRTGMRVGDLFYDLDLEPHLKNADKDIKSFGGLGLNREEVLAYCGRSRKLLEPYVCDTSLLLNDALDEGKNVLLEGAQGTLLDLDFGTYPFVTSSNTIAGNSSTGTGVGPNRIKEVIGVSKAYTTRVGEGPFPTESNGDDGKKLLEKGEEYGTTTGRPRRCGYLDLVILRYAKRVNGLSSIAITKLDVLEDFERIKVCVAYEKDGKEVNEFPMRLEGYEPVYEELEGWEKTVEGSLNPAARRYIKFIEEEVKVPVSLVSFGASREKTLRLE